MNLCSTFLTLFFLLTAIAEAQLPTAPTDESSFLTAPGNAGTEFYFSFPPCYEDESMTLGYCRVFVTSKTNQIITVEIPGRKWSQTKSVIANVKTEFTIESYNAQPFFKLGKATPPAEKIYSGCAVQVIAQSPVIVYGLTDYDYSSDGFMVLPVSGLGTEYIVASWPEFSGGSAYKLVSETTISAAYDSTEVTFTMGGTPVSETSGGLKPGQEKRFMMQKGDVLCFASNGGS